MDLSFSDEQEDLRREARAFLEANPSPSMQQLRELGWVGILAGADFSFLDAAVLFEELGRSLYAGPYLFNEVAAQPGDEVWSIEIDGFVPHLAQVTRVLTRDMHSTRAEGERLQTVDETLGLGRLARNGSEPATGSWPHVQRRLLAALALEAPVTTTAGMRRPRRGARGRTRARRPARERACSSDARGAPR